MYGPQLACLRASSLESVPVSLGSLSLPPQLVTNNPSRRTANTAMSPDMTYMM